MGDAQRQQIANRLESSLDRLDEAHWYLHEMDRHYHRATPFRYSLNSFLRAAKEVPQILKMEMQNTSGFRQWYRDHAEGIHSDPLLQFLFKQRDYVVHKSMLLPRSTVTLGITEGRGIKSGFGREFDPRRDSDAVMFSYVKYAALEEDWMGILQDDEDSLPCVERRWRLDQFPDTDVSSLAGEAWQKVGSLIAATVAWMGGPPMDLQLTCRHAEQVKRFLTFGRSGLRAAVELAKAGSQDSEVYAQVARSARQLAW